MSENFGVTIVVDTKGLQLKLATLGRDLDKSHILRMIGAGLLKWVSDNFRAEGLETKWKPLSPNTIAGRRKGSSKILQDTGRLRMSFIDDYGADWASVGSKDERAIWHHLGARARWISPVRAQALRFKAAWNGGKWVLRKKVWHPGLPSRQLLPSERAASDLVMRNVNAYIGAVLKKHA